MSWLQANNNKTEKQATTDSAPRSTFVISFDAKQLL